MPAKAKMHLRIVATPTGHHTYSIAVGGSRFGDGTSKKSTYVKHHVIPEYPRSALFSHAAGTAYLLARVNAQGRVDKVAAEEVDLTVSGTFAQERRARQALAKAAIRAIRRWTFNPPAFALKAGGGHWIVRIPVNFNLRGAGMRTYAYGQWQPYVPGPHRKISWNTSKASTYDNFNALPGGGLYAAGQGLHRITKPHS